MLKRQLIALLLSVFLLNTTNLESFLDDTAFSAVILDEAAANPEQLLKSLKSKTYANLFVCNCLKTRNLNVTGTATINDLRLLGTINNQPTKILYVDKNSTSPGTPDGSFYNPYLTIQDAINRIAANGDNNVNHYRIEVAPGTYTENLSFNNANLYSIALFGGSQVTLQGSSGALISSTTNNTQMTDLNFDGFILNGTGSSTGVVYSCTQQFFVGPIAAQFKNSTINCPISATLVQALTLDDCLCTGDIALTSVEGFTFLGGAGHLAGNLTLVGTVLASTDAFYNSTTFQGGGKTILIDANSTLTAQNSLVTDNGDTIINNGTINAYSSYLAAGTITNGGAINLFGSFYTHGINLTGAGTISTATPSELVDYAATATDWAAPAPTNVKQAIDRLAAQVYILSGNTPIP